MGNSKTGTLGKLSRRVRRNHERAIKARGKREKEMQMVAFKRGFNLGADMFKARILNATAGMEYEPEDNSDLEGLGYEADAKLLDGQPVEIALSDSGSVDSMSESTLGSDPVPFPTEADIFHDENGDPRTGYADGESIPA